MAYTLATFVSKDVPFDDGRVRITIEFTGAGETPKRATYVVGPADTFGTIRDWIDQYAARLGPVKTIVDSLTIGQTAPVRAIVPSTPTPEEIWRAKVSRYLAMQQVGLTGATAVANLATLKADIEATYLPAYL